MSKQTKNLPAPTNDSALEHDPEARMIAERVLALKEQTQWSIPTARGKPLSGDPLMNWVRKRIDGDAQSAIELGIGLILLKRELGHGSYEGFLRDEGVSPRWAREKVQSAQL